MTHLQNEIARARLPFEAAQQELAQLQQQLTTLIQARNTAQSQRIEAQSQLDTLQPLITERDEKQSQIGVLEAQETQQNNLAAGHAANAASYRAQAAPLRAQLSSLQAIAAQIPGLQATLNDWIRTVNNLNAELAALDRRRPTDPDELSDWYHERVTVANARDDAVVERNQAQTALTNAQNQVVGIPGLQQQIAGLDNNAANQDAWQQTALQAAASYRNQAQPIRDRVGVLNNLLINVPALQNQILSTTGTINSLEPQITTKQGAIAAAETAVETARVPLEELEALAASIEQEPLDRPALEQTATILGTHLQTLLESQAAARTRHAAATRRRAVVINVRNQRQTDKDALIAERAAAQNDISNITSQINAKNADIQSRETNLAGMWAGIQDQIEDRPVYSDYNNALEFQAARAMYWDMLESAQGSYEEALAAMLAVRQQLAPLELSLLQAQSRFLGLDGRVNSVQTEINTLDAQRDALATAAQNAQVEADAFQPAIGEYRVARETTTARLLGMLPGNLPVLFFPIRIETRFVNNENGDELLVRIYPDNIHVDTHEPELTAEERVWGQNFRQAIVAAGASDDDKKAAWQQLANRFGAARAAWIASVFETNRDSQIGSRPASWGRAAHSRVMPDRWVVTGYRGGRVELSRWSGPLIPDPLPIGPSPDMPPEQIDPFEDPGIAWMVDFNAALEAGMALRISLTSQQAQNGFDRLVVMGVKAFLQDKEQWQPADALESTARLAELLDAHHYTGGLALIPQYTPTNNTNQQPAGYAVADALDEELYIVERGPALLVAGDGSDGDLAAAALSLNAATFAHIRHADNREQNDAQMANAALWSVFQSHFLEAIMAVPASVWAGAHFAAYVRGRGPLPTLRIGNQPYGLLPVTSLERWVPQPEQEEADLALRLQNLQPVWRTYGERAGHAGRNGRVESMLYQQPSASRYLVAGFGGINRHGELPVAGIASPFATHLSSLSSRSPDILQALVAETLDLGSFRLDAWITSLATRRLFQLRSFGSNGIHLGSYGWVEDLRPSGPHDNQGYLQAPSLAQAATGAILRSGYLTHQARGDGDALAVDLSSDRVRRARWLLDGVREGQSLGALLGYRFERALQDNHLAHYIAPLRVLVALQDDEALVVAINLERSREVNYRAAQEYANTLGGELEAADLTLQNIQAELNRLLGERDQRRALLAQLTVSQAAISLRQAEVNTAQQAIQTHWANRPRSRSNRPANVTQDVENAVERPSEGTITNWHTRRRELQAVLNQAEANLNAAVIHRDNLAGGPNQYDVALANHNSVIAGLDGIIGNLQNERNNAQAVVDQLDLELNGDGGAREQEVEANNLWLATVGALHTLLQQQWQQATESIAAHNVVDGLELRRRWRLGVAGQGARWNAATIPWGDSTVGLPAMNTTEHGQLTKQLMALDEMVDAVSDVLVAEGVYQLVQGNTARAGATLEAIATGQVAPPELEVLRTPRTGISLTHRVLALFRAGPPDEFPWGANPQNPRALAEPHLNGWVTQLLVNPANVHCRVAFLDPATGEVIAQDELSLDMLQLSPLDALYLAESTGNAQQSELEHRLTYYAMLSRPAEISAEVQLRLDFQRNPEWSASMVGVAEFLENIRAVRTFVTSARPIDARDLAMPEQELTIDVDITELQGRADAAAQTLQQAYQSLLAVPSEGDDIASALRTALMRLADFGISGTIPVNVIGEEQEDRMPLAEQAQTVEREVVRRLERLQQHDAVTPDNNAAAQCDYHIERLQIIFGEGFRVLPQICLTQASELEQAFDESRSLVDSEPMAAAQWFQQMSQVRDGTNRFHTALAYAEALETGASLDLRIGQLPYVAGDRWVALPTTTTQPINSGRLSLVAHLPAGFQFAQPIAGLLVDEWVEMVPSPTEVTGVAFHFDQPDAQPPQSLLLAVPPDVRPERMPAAWDLDTLEATLRETLDLARVRVAVPRQFATKLWHTIQHSDGAWSDFTNLDEATDKRENWQAIATAGVNQNLHLVGRSSDGRLWHTIRYPDGGWQPFGDLTGAAGDRGAFSEVACAGVGNTLHVCAISTTGLWHTIRFADESWQAFGDVEMEGQAGHRGARQKVACAAIDSELHVCLVTRDGKLWHTIRRADESWYPFGDVEGQVGDRGHILSVACAAVGNTLHLCVTSTTGLWHTVRWADGSWHTFGNIQEQAGSRSYVEEAACAGIGEELHLRVLTTDTRVWQTTRLAHGAWLPFREVTGLSQGGHITCAAVAEALHLVDTSAEQLSTRLYFAASALNLNALPG